MANNNRILNSTRLVPGFILCLGLALTWVLQDEARDAARQAVRTEFDLRVREFVQYIDRRMNTYEQMLQGAAGLFAASDAVERREFKTYVGMLRVGDRYPGIQGVGFSKAIAPQDRAAHVKKVRAEGFPDYDIRPAGERALYTSIIYLEPFDWRNQRAFGFDMYSEPVRRAAMERARDGDTSAISGKVKLVQETEQDVQPGFLMYLPVYRSGALRRTAEERRAALVGWVYAPFRMRDLMNGMLGRWSPEMKTLIDFEIYDGDTTNQETLLFDPGTPASKPGPLFRAATPLDLFGRRWTIVAHSLPAFDARLDYDEANIIAGSGTVGSALLAMVVWLLATGRARALAMAADMTRELRASETWQRKLNRALRLLSDCNTALVHADDEQKLLDEICRLCVGHGGYLMAWVGYAERDERKTVRPVARSGYEEGYLDHVAITWGDDVLGAGPTGTAIRTRTTSTNPDVAINERMAPWRDAAIERGYRSSIGLPLVVGSEVLGALTLYAGEADAFNADEMRLLEELARNVAYGIGALRTRAERVKAEAEVRSLNLNLEARVAERTLQLEAANKELEAFAYSVSHDLRAPLRHIDGFIHLLKEDVEATLNDEDRHYMESILAAANRMQALIDDLLAFSRMGRSEMSQVRVDLGALVRDVLQELEPEQKDRSVEWRIGDLPAVSGDRAMLRVVLMNLCSNALKFTRHCAQAVIEIGATAGHNAETIVFVRDNGAGFDMNFADKLFGVFQRLHRADEFEGTGIGLANVRRVVARHGGKTWAEGEVGKGATFYFSLPPPASEPA